MDWKEQMLEAMKMMKSACADHHGMECENYCPFYTYCEYLALGADCETHNAIYPNEFIIPGNHKKEKIKKKNEALINTIEGILSTLEAPSTITDLIASNDTLTGYSKQKISALLHKMVETGRAVKTFDGKKAVFFHA